MSLTPLCDELRQMSERFAEAMPGFYLCDLTVPQDIFDKLLMECHLMTQFRLGQRRPFVALDVTIGNLRVRPYVAA